MFSSPRAPDPPRHLFTDSIVFIDFFRFTCRFASRRYAKSCHREALVPLGSPIPSERGAILYRAMWCVLIWPLLSGISVIACSTVEPQPEASVTMEAPLHSVVPERLFEFQVKVVAPTQGELRVHAVSLDDGSTLWEANESVAAGQLQKTYTLQPPGVGLFAVSADLDVSNQHFSSSIRFGVRPQSVGPAELLTFKIGALGETAATI